MKTEYQLIRAKRKTVSLKVDSGGQAVVRAPFGVSEKDIDAFVEEHRDWIEKTRRRALEKKSKTELSPSDAKRLREATRCVMLQLVEKWSRVMAVEDKISAIRITGAKNRFGSCSSKGTVSFSMYLTLYPYEGVEYVCVHELSHLRHMNHSPAFWQEVERWMPDWKNRRALLVPENMSKYPSVNT